MKKKFTYLLLLTVLLTGCSANNKKAETPPKKNDQSTVSKDKNSSETTKSDEEQVEAVEQKLSDPTVIDGLRMMIGKKETSDMIDNGEKKVLYSFEVEGKNISADPKGMGAIDFILTTEDGEAFSIDDTISNFGNELKPDEEIKGKLNFSVPADKKVKKIEYKPLDTSLVSWEIGE